jgi:hypothetical protein
VKKLTKEQRLVALMADGRWHSGRELALTVSHRFGGYLFNLKKHGFVWEKRLDPTRPFGEVWYLYRLNKFPGATAVDAQGQHRIEVGR